MQPLYYLGGLEPADLMVDDRASRVKLTEGGLGHLVCDLSDDDAAQAIIMRSVVQNGPDGGRGVCVAAKCIETERTSAGQTPTRFGVHLERQRWEYSPDRPKSGRGSLWIGIDTSEPTLPEQLERPTSLGGHWRLEMGDAQRWIVPTLRLPADMPLDPDRPVGSVLPVRYRAVGDHVEELVLDRYRKLWTDSGRVIDHFVGGTPDTPGPLADEAEKLWRLDYALRALALNYRVSMLEQNALGLITSANWQLVLAATVGAPAWRTGAEKKTEEPTAANGDLPELASSNAGSAG